ADVARDQQNNAQADEEGEQVSRVEGHAEGGLLAGGVGPLQPFPAPLVALVELGEGSAEGGDELGEEDQPRAEFERPADEELPDEQEGHQAAPARFAVAAEQELVRAAR